MLRTKIAAGATVLALTMGYASFAMAAADTNRDVILQSCATELLLGEGQCACIADKAEADLNETTIVLFASLITDPDNAGAAMASSGITQEEMASLRVFMQTAPQICLTP